ncbi:uncharacterized protein TNIN_339471 [Trichonephila inaurata madagascariensis]|uniref:Vacuolar ATPase assembly protein VMA22 n=1 Tax=Trichonephila inaurata madagascariensis TaxID=2747483 RepID=A0A8X6K1T2_9ARAC|nr:uncharacterized protein TNIN_339471 [Trichonephila inaurata madagascariensis]
MSEPHLDIYETDEIKKSEFHSELKDVCQEMDQLTMAILHTLQSILVERKYLEAYLKEGYINMAKSRYLMRDRKIDIHQVDSNSLTASFRISSYLDVDDAVQDVTFLNYNPIDNSALENTRSKLKHRSANSENELIGKIQQVSLSDSEEGDDKTSASMKDSILLDFVDPLKWFGILVPDSLRICQSHFKQSLVTAIKITSLQNKLMTLRVKYKELKKIKSMQ